MLKNLTSTLPVSVKTMPFESYVRAYEPLAPVEAVKRPVVPASLHDKHASESEEPLLPKVKEGTAKAMPAAKAQSSHSVSMKQRGPMFARSPSRSP
ncbi:hypothetical protein EXIGLDRAFT_462477 [Exidia glandulosa HHB12029]|uniref:Uncharacterized protein n=1 Tax=Exidia glandulosa HHB12029 TaxID=1314781 RepID=A0A165K3A1_EXIGL|nr:hypothetical protein EXIGLDRAFT_462477 [Exidia glandulosa HHB12029]